EAVVCVLGKGVPHPPGEHQLETGRLRRTTEPSIVVGWVPKMHGHALLSGDQIPPARTVGTFASSEPDVLDRGASALDPQYTKAQRQRARRASKQVATMVRVDSALRIPL